MRLRSAGSVAIAVIVWGGAVAFGLTRIWAYSMTPGIDASHPATWPAHSAIERSSVNATLVMFVHPRCSCTRASLAELRHVMQAAGGNLTAVVVFIRPADGDDSWDRTDTWKAAQQIPGVRIRADVDGDEAERFGALTSGLVLLYAPSGDLRFAGGITGSRGEEGDNPGRRRVIAMVTGQRSDHRATSVFGCPLLGPLVAL